MNQVLIELEILFDSLSQDHKFQNYSGGKMEKKKK